MKIKISVWLVLSLFVLILGGCGGKSNTSGLGKDKRERDYSYLVGNQGFQKNAIFVSELERNLREANALLSESFMDTFDIPTINNNWIGPFLEGNYDIVSQNGMLTIWGDATQNSCYPGPPGYCVGRAYIASKTTFDPAFSIVGEIDLDMTGSSAVAASDIASTFMFLDKKNQFFSLFMAVGSDAFCQGVCLGFTHVGLGGTVILKTNISSAGHLKIIYQKGDYTVSFNGEIFPTITGPILDGEVHAVLIGGTHYDTDAGVNPSQVVLQSKFDNFSTEVSFYSPCDTSISKTTLENVKQGIDSLIQEMEQAGKGFAQQALSIVRSGVEQSIDYLNQDKYMSAMNSLKGVIGRLYEVERTLDSMRGKTISPNLVDKWIKEVIGFRSEIQLVINEVAICKTPVTPPPTLTSIEISPTIWSMTVGDTKSFSAKCYYSSGPSSDCTSVVTWNSSNSAIANFMPSQPNLLESFAKGTTNITATSQGITSNIAMVSVFSSSIVSTDANVFSTAFDKIKIARDSIGNLYFAYCKKYRGDPQIFVAKSTNNGNTWSDMSNAPIQHIQGHEQYYPSVVIDSQDNIHIVWQGYDRAYTPYYQIKYSKYNGSSWSVWTNIQPTQYYNQSEPMITIDSQDNLHVVWYGYDSANPQHSQIKYSKYSGGSWSAWTNIQPISGYEQNAPAIAVDSQNNLHIVWYGTNSGQYYYQIKYSKYSGGIWSTWTNIQLVFGADAAQYRPAIAIDSQDNIHVVWRGRTDVDSPSFQIKYSRYSAGGWSTWTNIQPIYWYNQLEPTIAIDATDRLHVIWPGYDAGNPDYLQIKYTSCVNNCENFASWSSWINKTSSTTANQGQPTFRWSWWNNNAGSLNWGWMDGTTVMFDKDTSVTMANY